MRPLVLSAFLLAGCDSLIYGAGALYVYNGTEHAVELGIDGRTPRHVLLKPERGELLADMVAGPYAISFSGRSVAVEVVADRLTLMNVEAAGCFARLDVIGMYQPGKEPARVLQTYDGEEVIAVADVIAVPPGERLPTAAPRTPYTYQRLIVVPCHLLEDEAGANYKVAEYARRVR